MKFSESIELDCPGEVQTDHCLLRDFPIELDLCYLDIEEIENSISISSYLPVSDSLNKIDINRRNQGIQLSDVEYYEISKETFEGISKLYDELFKKCEH